MMIQNPNRNEVPGGLRDPAITTYDGKYYMVATSPEFFSGHNPGVRLWSSEDLVNWTFEKVILAAEEIPEECNCKHRFWAPELLIHDGKFYCTVSGRNEDSSPDSPDQFHVYLAVADDIRGPYRLFCEPMLENSYIDASLFADDDGKVYLTATASGNHPRYGCIFMAQMDLSTGRPLTQPRLILTPSEPGKWDYGTEPRVFVEGNHLVKRGGVYYLWYSGIGRSYEMGLCRADSIDGEFVRCCQEPVLSGWDTEYSYAGHNSCFRLLDGRDAVAFHAHTPDDWAGRLWIELVEYPMKPRKIRETVTV